MTKHEKILLLAGREIKWLRTLNQEDKMSELVMLMGS